MEGGAPHQRPALVKRHCAERREEPEKGENRRRRRRPCWMGVGVWICLYSTHKRQAAAAAATRGLCVRSPNRAPPSTATMHSGSARLTRAQANPLVRSRAATRADLAGGGASLRGNSRACWCRGMPVVVPWASPTCCGGTAARTRSLSKDERNEREMSGSCPSPPVKAGDAAAGWCRNPSS